MLYLPSGNEGSWEKLPADSGFRQAPAGRKADPPPVIKSTLK